MKCEPRFIIPEIVVSALGSSVIWTLALVLVLLSFPVAGDVAGIIERHRDALPLLIDEENPPDSADPRIIALEKEFGALNDSFAVLILAMFLVVIAALIAWFFMFSWVTAGTYGYIFKGVTSEMDFRHFLYYAGNYAFKIAGLWFMILTMSAILLLLPFTALLLLPPPFNIIVAAVWLLVFALIWVALMLLLFFAGECVVIDGRGIFASMGRSMELVVRNAGSTLLFLLFEFVIFSVFGIIYILANTISGMFKSDISPFFTMVSAFALAPLLSLAKMNFFLAITGKSIRPMSAEVAYFRAAWKFVWDSPRILLRFVRSNAIYVMAAAVSVLLGISAGYYIGIHFSFLGDELTRPISNQMAETLFGPYTSLPSLDFIGYMSNNAVVSMNIGLSGIFFGMAPLTGLAFNGVVVGFIYGLVPADVATAFLAVHGVFEFAGFILAGGAGMKLGVRLMNRDSAGYDNANHAAEETIRVILASQVLIALAALLEAFITPIVVSILI